MFGTRHQELTAETRRRSGGDFVELAAGVTHYELRGDEEAETVVLIHGNAAPSATWEYTIGPLCDAGFRVLRYDVFGHGLSDRPALKTYDRRLYTTQLKDLLQRLDITLPVGLVGSSQGAASLPASPPSIRRRSAGSPCWHRSSTTSPVRAIPSSGC